MTTGPRETSSPKDRLVWLMDELFKDRQILLRSDSRVRCLTLPRRLQMFAVVVLLGCGFWSLVSTVGFFWHAERNGNLSLALAESKAAQQRMTEAGYRYGEEIAQLRRWLSQQGHREASASSRIILLEAALEGATDLAGNLDQERGLLASRLVELEQELAGARANHASLIDHVSERLRRGIQSIEGLADTIGLDLSGLVPKDADPSEEELAGLEGKGGPLVIDNTVRNSDGAPRPRHWTPELDRQLERWERLQGVVGRLPLAAPLARYRVTSKFGKRRDPISGRRAMHQGVDLAAPAGAPVSAAAGGRVVKAGFNGTYGHMIELAHGNGVRTRYGHLRKLLVKAGEKVKPGQRIGLVGSTGRSTGPHLHYEVRLGGRPVDPLKVFRAGKKLADGITAPFSLASDFKAD